MLVCLKYDQDKYQGRNYKTWHAPEIDSIDLTGLDELDIGAIDKAYAHDDCVFLREDGGRLVEDARFSIKKMLAKRYVRLRLFLRHCGDEVGYKGFGICAMNDSYDHTRLKQLKGAKPYPMIMRRICPCGIIGLSARTTHDGG